MRGAVLEINLQMNETIVSAVFGAFRNLIQPAIPKSKETTDKGLWKIHSGAAFGLGTQGL